MRLMRGWLDYDFECKQIPCWFLETAVLPIGNSAAVYSID